jgi:hypothetical protein
MAFEELDQLFSDMTEADRTAVKGILERNAPAAQRLSQRETVYTAFVDGDTAKLATLTTPVATVPVVTTPSVDLDALNRSIDDRLGKIYDDPRFVTAVETRAKTLADAAIAAARQNIIGAGAEVADQIYLIRSTHQKEFGTELDRSKFDPFFTENAAKYGHNLMSAYNAFVNEDRINKRVEAARAEGLAASATRDVPGVSQPGAASPAGMFMAANPMNTGAASKRGDALDAAAAAFRNLRQASVN